MYRLSDDRSEWELYARATPRAVHRLIPDPDRDRILVVGGAANRKMVDLIETVAVPAPEARTATSATAR
jgi:hypothetical protein